MFQNKKILILGAARSGIACCKVLANLNNKIVLNDIKDEKDIKKEDIEELKKLNVTCCFGVHPDDLLDDSFDFLVKNPGIRNDHKYVKLASKLGIPVINEVEVGYHLLPKNINLIAITGTNGKTTTTTLTYEILKEAYQDKVHLAGNIGYPLCSILPSLKEGDILVMEVSCQQLANLHEFKPHIALLTNLSEAHIDFFGDYETYKKVKIKLFKNQNGSDIAILNQDNLNSLESTKNIKSKRIYFSLKEKANATYYDHKLYYRDEFIIDRSNLLIKGDHNIANSLGAILIAKELNVETKIIQKVLKRFSGVIHRLELVADIAKRKFYNDTEATNIKCTQIALSSFSKPIILFLGGLDRGQDFYELKPFMQNVKAIIALGECRLRVKEFGDNLKIPTYVYEYLKDGFKKAWKISLKEDIILLSPASASWDQYKECEDRGDEFKKLVEELKDGSIKK